MQARRKKFIDREIKGAVILVGCLWVLILCLILALIGLVGWGIVELILFVARH